MTGGFGFRLSLVRAAVASAPRHLLLAALVGGLLAGPTSLPALAATATLAGVAPASAPLGAAAAAAVVLGGELGQRRAHAVEHGPAQRLHGRAVAGSAVVLEPPRRRPRGVSVARVRLADGPAAGDAVVLRTRRPMDWPPVGGEVAYRGTAGEVDGPEAWQARRGAHALVDATSVRATGRRRGGPAGILDGVRERGLHALGAGIPATEAALLRGMVLGDDADVPEELRTAFEVTSLAHLLAVSGQNVVLLAALVVAAATAVGVGLRARLGAALVAVLLYVPLTGAGASIQRAGVMGAAGLVAALAGRPASRWYAIGLAVAVTLAWNPYAVREVAWQLSFAAVVAMLVAVPPLREGLRRRQLPGALADALAVTLAATLGTAPLLAIHFQQLSLVSLPANLLAAPAVAPLMWLGMIAAAVGQLHPALASPPAELAAVLAAFVGWIAEQLATIPAAAVTPGPVLTAAVTVSCSLALGALAAGGDRLAAARLAIGAAIRRPSLDVASKATRDVPGHRRGHAGGSRRSTALQPRALAGITLAAILVSGALLAGRGGPAPPATGELVVAFLDVGQGDATLLRRDGATVLVDTGPPDGPVVRRLAQEGVERLDALLLTHAQADHEGAALDVIRTYRPRLVLNGGDGQPSPVQAELAAAVAASGSRAVAAHAGRTLRLGGMTLRLLWPPPRPAGPPPPGDPNDRAVVTHVTAGSFDLLLPADAESPVSGRLALPPVEALKVAHHGSADEGLPALLERLRPAVAAIPVGRRNSYGHPAPSTLEALRVVPHVLRTDQDGTVRLRVQRGELSMERSGVRR